MGKQYQKQLDNLIKQSKPRVIKIAVPSEYIGYTGNIKNAVFLSQLIYWAERAERPDGGVYKSTKDWKAEIGLTKQEVTNARKALENLGIIRVEKHRANGHCTNHYYLDFQALESSFKAYLGIDKQADVLDAEFVEVNEVVEAEFVEESEVIEAEFVPEPQVKVPVKTAANQRQKTPMPKDFVPSEETMQELRDAGYHPLLLDKYVKDCRHFYTIKNERHRYPDWNEVFKWWCSRNPKKDANTETADRLKELSTGSAISRVGTTDFRELYRLVRQK